MWSMLEQTRIPNHAWTQLYHTPTSVRAGNSVRRYSCSHNRWTNAGLAMGALRSTVSSSWFELWQGYVHGP